jgi:ferredoxin--NADP+ reductase
VYICVATGTGIAPYRSFWRRMFFERPKNFQFTGLCWLFMGVANSDAKLYDEELQVSVTFFFAATISPPCFFST